MPPSLLCMKSPDSPSLLMNQPDIRAIRADLHRMRMQLIEALEEENHEDDDRRDLLTRNGSVIGRSLHVKNTLRLLATKGRWKKDYATEEDGQVVVYITTCGVLHSNYERCRDVMRVLHALNVQVQIKDVYIEPKLMAELLDRMQLSNVRSGQPFCSTEKTIVRSEHRDLALDSLPMVYVNGRYFGNDVTIHQKNEAKSLAKILKNFQGRENCNSCGNVGYTICSRCRGGKKSDQFESSHARLKKIKEEECKTHSAEQKSNLADPNNLEVTRVTFSVRLKCTSCNANGISPCESCSPPIVS